MREIRVSQEAIKAVYAENKFLKQRIAKLERELAEKNRRLKKILDIILRAENKKKESLDGRSRSRICT